MWPVTNDSHQDTSEFPAPYRWVAVLCRTDAVPLCDARSRSPRNSPPSHLPPPPPSPRSLPDLNHCALALNHSAIMADSASESDTDGAGSSTAVPQCSSSSASGKPGIVISPFRLEELTNRLASLQQENKVLKIELETFKLKCKALQEENRDLRKASVTIVSRARAAMIYLPGASPTRSHTDAGFFIRLFPSLIWRPELILSV